jgi:NAD+ kinase
MSQPTRRLAVLGDGDPTDAVRSAAANAGARLVAPADADAVVAVGGDAVREAMRAAASDDARDAPILPVGAGRRAVAPERAADRVAAALDGSEAAFDALPRAAHPVLAVTGGGADRRRFAAADVAFVTATPARISEYAIAFDGGESATVRADGAVVATPFGSDGYAAAAGGPTVAPGGGLAVVPVAPFTTRPESWVATDGLAVTVAREGEPVALIVDGRRRGTVEPHRPVRIDVAATVELLSPASE